MTQNNDVKQFTRIRYELPEENIARVVLAKPETRNTQDYAMLYEIDAAFQIAARDPKIKVIILAADGPMFSSGHDLTQMPGLSDKDITPITQPVGHDDASIAGMYAGEEEYYVGLHWRWRNIGKPTIAQVQGLAIAGGLMLAMPMDLIIASDDAKFVDPVVAFGCTGHEYFLHAWEFGPRKAKEMLFTGEPLTAEECHRLGMVNHVVPLDELEAFTLEKARRIATRPAFALKMAKQAVNYSMDLQGQGQALTGTLAMHNLGHAHARMEYGMPLDPTCMGSVREEMKNLTKKEK
ncbi:MAG: enoyl-CoA hydratase [Pseudomonadota bacterium]